MIRIEYEGAVHDILGQALKKDLKQVLTLGLQTVCKLLLAMLQLFSKNFQGCWAFCMIQIPPYRE